MSDDSKLRPYGDISVVIGTYNKDGVEKNRYQKVGTLFATPHFSRISIKLDALPRLDVSDGWLSVYPREKKDDDSLMGGTPIEDNNIPF